MTDAIPLVGPITAPVTTTTVTTTTTTCTTVTTTVTKYIPNAKPTGTTTTNANTVTNVSTTISVNTNPENVPSTNPPTVGPNPQNSTAEEIAPWSNQDPRWKRLVGTNWADEPAGKVPVLKDSSQGMTMNSGNIPLLTWKGDKEARKTGDNPVEEQQQVRLVREHRFFPFLERLRVAFPVGLVVYGEVCEVADIRDLWGAIGYGNGGGKIGAVHELFGIDTGLIKRTVSPFLNIDVVDPEETEPSCQIPEERLNAHRVIPLDDVRSILEGIVSFFSGK